MKHPDYWIIAAIVPLCSIAGLAASYRAAVQTNRVLTRQEVISALLNSGLCGGAIACLMFWNFGLTNALLNIGVSLLAGLGGNVTLDFAIGIAQRVISAAIKRIFGNDQYKP